MRWWPRCEGSWQMSCPGRSWKMPRGLRRPPMIDSTKRKSSSGLWRRLFPPKAYPEDENSLKTLAASVLSQRFFALKYEAMSSQVLCLQHRRTETYSTNLQFRTLALPAPGCAWWRATRSNIIGDERQVQTSKVPSLYSSGLFGELQDFPNCPATLTKVLC